MRFSAVYKKSIIDRPFLNYPNSSSIKSGKKTIKPFLMHHLIYNPPNSKNTENSNEF